MKVCDLVQIEIVYRFLMKLDVLMELIMLNEMCLNFN